MRRSRTITLLAATTIALAACGGSAPSADEVASSAVPVLPDTANPVPDSEAVTADDSAVDGGSTDGGVAGDTAVDTAPAASDDAPAESTAGEPAVAESTPAAPEPGGRALGSELRPESAFASNPLPDLLVDDVRRGTEVNVANLLPSERPVLLWAWAPH